MTRSTAEQRLVLGGDALVGDSAERQCVRHRVANDAVTGMGAVNLAGGAQAGICVSAFTEDPQRWY